MIKIKQIDNNREFDWGKTSEDYAKYRDIYPQEFYQKILDLGLCKNGQKVLDIGTGTGVLPRHMYRYGASFTGIDIAENQIIQAKRLSEQAGYNIPFFCSPAEELNFEQNSFDTITACQCFFYFNHDILAPELFDLLNQHGKLVFLYMAWLPFEDPVAAKSEELVLKYNPAWTGDKETRHVIKLPEIYKSYFHVEQEELFDLKVPFTRETWNGRMKSCRGIGAALPEEEVINFEQEHLQLLEQISPATFEVLHFAAITVMTKK